APCAEQALTTLLDSKNESTQHAAWEAARYFELNTLVGQACKEAVDSKLPLAKRVTAIRALQSGHFTAVSPVLDQVLQELPTPDIEAAAVDSLASFDDLAAGQIILKHWGTLTHDGREHALAALVAHRNRAPLLLKAIEDGQIKPSALDASVRSHLYENPDPVVAKRSRSLLANTNSDPAKVVAGYQSVLTMQGHTENGSILFAANCGRCHMPRVKGGRVGPDLSGI